MILAGLLLEACAGAAASPRATPAPASAAATQVPAPGQVLATGVPVPVLSDGCRLLGPGDFAAAGVAGAGIPQPIAGAASAACRYAPTNGSVDAIELRVLHGTDAADAARLFVTPLDAPRDEGAGRKALPEVDDAVLQLTDDYGQAFALLAVRKGRLCFSIGFTPGEHPADQLVSLARLVLARAATLVELPAPPGGGVPGSHAGQRRARRQAFGCRWVPKNAVMRRRASAVSSGLWPWPRIGDNRVMTRGTSAASCWFMNVWPASG